MRKLQIILIQNNEGVILTVAVRSVLAAAASRVVPAVKCGSKGILTARLSIAHLVVIPLIFQ